MENNGKRSSIGCMQTSPIEHFVCNMQRQSGVAVFNWYRTILICRHECVGIVLDAQVGLLFGCPRPWIVGA